MGSKRSLHPDTPSKRIKLISESESDSLALPSPQPHEMHIFQRSPSPEPGLASWSSSIRGLFSNIGGGDQNNEVVNGATPEPSNIFTAASGAMSTLGSQLPRLRENIGLVASIARTNFLHGGMVDDKKYELESIIQLAASLPPNSKPCKDLAGLLIKPLWNDLCHPPLSILGNDYQYRKSDGSNNNLMYPRLGAAGSNYARTVTPQTLTPSVLPDPGLIFDTIYARRDVPREHPNQVSSVLFYMASIIIHDIFRSDERDSNKLKNSSYLDLSPLYGNSDDPDSDACVAKVRTFKDGMLKPDVFNESRIHGLPPGVAVLLICFNRFHNYVASQLKEINEGNRFGRRRGQSEEQAQKRIDEDLFQTARLVTCGLYVNIILHDYVRTILNLQTSDSSWTLDPRADCESIFDEHGVPSGIGNQVSVEFNLVYRWHSAISERDNDWVQAFYRKIFGTEDISPYLESPETFFSKAGPWFAKIKRQSPEQRELLGLSRNEHGKYEDEDLVRIMTESTEDVAGAFGPRNVPVAMKVIEIMGIQQAREWNVCTLNEFRKFFKLRPHRTFADITKDEEVQRTLETLYSKPDYVELYPGLVAEDAKDVKEPGSGLCPGFTTSRTILADAVALTRGDRFYTVDYTPANLTNWGWNLVKSDPEVAGGGVVYTLLTRAMPSFYRGNSVYAMFPFMHPDKTKKTLTNLGKVEDYDFSTPRRTSPPVPIRSHEAVTTILKNQRGFNVPWGPHTYDLTGHDYMLSGDLPPNQEQRCQIKGDMYAPGDWAQQINDYYYKTTSQLIESHSNELQKNQFQLDIVKDVANPSHTRFVAQMFLIPLKDSDEFLVGATTRELYQGLAVLFAYVFLDGDTARSFKLRANAREATEKLKKLLRGVVEAVAFGNDLHLNKVLDRHSAGKLLSGYGRHMIERLIRGGTTVDEVVAAILPTAAAAVATQAQAMAQMLDVYLRPKHMRHWTDIRRCAYSDDPEDFKTLQKYALEACRLEPAAFGVLRVAAEGGVIHDGARAVKYQKGSLIYTDFVSASQDEKVFPNADEIDPTRDLRLYIHHGIGPHSCLGRQITQISLAVQLKLFAKLKNLQRMPGLAGELKHTTEIPWGNPGSVRLYMSEDWSNWWPYPTTMKVQHEGICRTIEEHGTIVVRMQDRNRTDSGISISIPDIRMNGHV